MADIFLSYKSEDRPRILPLVRALEARGYTVWWDLELIAGEKWSRRIRAELAAARCVVVVWTRLSVSDEGDYTSDWVEIEASHGRSKGVLVPALIDFGRVAFAHSAVQYADLVGWRGQPDHEGFAKLLKGVSQHAGPRDRPEEVELVAWGVAELDNSMAGYRDFVSAHPASRFADTAKGRAEELEEVAAWAALGDAPGLRDLTSFLRRFPKGRFADAAETRIARIVTPPPPDPDRSERTNDEEQAWTALGPAPSASALIDFLSRFPKGRFADVAMAMLPPVGRAAQVPRSPTEAPPAPWASTFGRDVHGDFAGLVVEGVTQILRWIPPGRFMMGSPEDEPGRWDDEGPRHQVTLSAGFWLFESPCTQALWRAVMGNNPSKFRGPERPVESVSWKDASDFIGGINALVPGLDLSLPTEAQWEYACRAGTESAIYSGPMPILDGGKAQALDPIAWYGGNSGGETHPVGQKAANAWGLYDMLGNVWEWCRDGKRVYDASAVTDPGGSTGGEARRVVRGGSWDDDARFVRAACRFHYDPAGRSSVLLGFRCARVQG